jgi:hypothetical protein
VFRGCSSPEFATVPFLDLIILLRWSAHCCAHLVWFCCLTDVMVPLNSLYCFIFAVVLFLWPVVSLIRDHCSSYVAYPGGDQLVKRPFSLWFILPCYFVRWFLDELLWPTKIVFPISPWVCATNKILINITIYIF